MICAAEEQHAALVQEIDTLDASIALILGIVFSAVPKGQIRSVIETVDKTPCSPAQARAVKKLMALIEQETELGKTS